MPDEPVERERSSRIARLSRAWPYLLVAFLYLATSPYHQGLNNPNEMVRVYMTKALVDSGTMVIDRVLLEWGGVDDKAIRDGKLYSSKAPLQSLIGVPIFAAARPILALLGITPTKRSFTTILRIFGSALPGILFASLLIAWARKRAQELGASRALGTAAGLSIGLGTMLYPYSLTYTGHSLAAFSAGGAYLAVIAMHRSAISSARWRALAFLAGFGAGAAPFAEYPASLVAAPAIAGALFVTPTWRKRAEVAVLLLAGGAPPFLLGAWAHEEAWGSPFKTGYAFLENVAYVEVHGEGFFGVSLPKAQAFFGSLFSPGTGLFFFSPVLIIGLLALIVHSMRGTSPSGGDPPQERARDIARSLAIAGLIGFALEILFISGHKGWRGGWTIGPRYIIAVAPLLGLWVIEALAWRGVRHLVAGFGAASIALTGFGAALYPHLSDVYTNPLRTFLFPSYLRGEMAYGIAHAIGLEGHAANLVHVIPLIGALAVTAFSGARRGGELARRSVCVLATFLVTFGVVVAIPERDRESAEQENQRLWGFWEPRARPTTRSDARPPIPSKGGPSPLLVYSGREHWREARIERVGPDGRVRPCIPEGTLGCRYGDEPWQRFGPDTLEMSGERRPILFMHPVERSVVRARFPVRPGARRATLRYGLADASVESGNTSPVRVRLFQGNTLLVQLDATNVRGLQARDFSMTSTAASLTLEISTDRDGARAFGFDLEIER